MLIDSIKKGTKTGLETTYLLIKVILPVYFIVTLLQHTPVLDWTADLFKPIMSIFNLPGEAAIVLVLGNALNLYAAVGAIQGMQLTSIEITNLAIMLSFSHSLFVETVVTKKLGVSTIKVVMIRAGLATAAGIIIGQIGALL